MKIIAILFFTINLFSSEILIAIDAGHTPKSKGAVSARGIGEYTFNYRLALELQRAFQKKNINSFVINRQGREISLKERTKIATDLNATLFISLHHDSAQLKYFDKWSYKGKKLRYCDKFSGYSIFFSRKNINAKENLIFANKLGTQLLLQGLKPTLHHAANIKGENRTLINNEKGIYEFNELAVLRTASIPAVLLESGLIVNRDEEEKLNTIEYREKIIMAIVQSVITNN